MQFKCISTFFGNSNSNNNNQRGDEATPPISNEVTHIDEPIGKKKKNINHVMFYLFPDTSVTVYIFKLFVSLYTLVSV